MNPRIIFVITRYNPPMTGGEIYNTNMIDYFQRNGIKPHVFSSDNAPWPSYRKGLMNHLLFNLTWLPFILSLNSKRATFIFTAYLHSRMFLPVLILALLGQAKLVGICHHLTYHDLKSSVGKKVDRCFEILFLRLMKYVITISKSTRHELVSLSVCPDKIYIVAPGFNKCNKPIVQYRDNSKSSGKFRVLFVGTCYPRKGIKYLLQAVHLLKDKIDIIVHIVGDTEDDPSHFQFLVDFVDQKLLSDNVKFHGRVKEEDINALFGLADAFVLPSLWEGYGIVLFEAMSWGLPIIATNIGSIPDLVINGVNGLLVPPCDSQALAEALFLLSHDKSLCLKLGEKGRTMYSKMPTWDEMGERFKKVVLSLD